MHIFFKYHVEGRAFTLNIIKSKSEQLLRCICGKFTFLFYSKKNTKKIIGLKNFDKGVELVGGGSVINGANYV